MPTATPIPEPVARLLTRRDPVPVIAVVGASSNPEKYGNRIVKNLAAKGYRVVPVNPRETEIEGLLVAASLADAGRVDVAVLVVPAKVGLETLRAVPARSVPVVWFQPGAADADAVAYAAAHFDHVVSDGSCVMVVTAGI